ncbi:M20/M25/M40 family metallo-hydrolase [Alteromonas lipotrueiana]|mgnify:CR=1 FL=1|uniref:M20/M25/M40 family metallo-hydrolase n=1 Tax=Alteromonas lipotrueiana TaxID=2803815 RepID=UPI0031B877D0
MKKRAVFSLLMCACSQAFGSLSSAEQQAVDYIDAHHSQAVTLLEKSVNINSGTMNFEGVKKTGQMLLPEFEALGFTASMTDGSSYGRAGHLVAKKSGTGPKILLIGHLDTVFEPDSPFQSFEATREGWAKGPGIADMKGGNIIILQTLRALHAAGELENMSIQVVMTGDEESSGRPLSKSKAELIEAAKWADVALGFENGDGDPATANTSRRGAMGWTLTVKGTPSHSSQVFQPEIGAGAIYEVSRILHTFYTQLRDEKLLTFNPGKIVGGTQISHLEKQNKATTFGKDNVVAESALVTGDIRALSIDQVNRVKQKMRDIVSQNLPKTSASIEFAEGYPPLAPTAANAKLLSLYSQASLMLGLGEVTAIDPRNAGAADVAFTAEHVKMALDGLGMGGTAGHTVNEEGDLSTLRSQAKRAALLMYRLHHDGLPSTDN